MGGWLISHNDMKHGNVVCVIFVALPQLYQPTCPENRMFDVGCPL